MQVLRSMLAVLLGYAIFGVSGRLLLQVAGIDPHRPESFFGMLLSVLFGAFVAFFAGYAAGFIAGQKPLIHAMSISILLGFGAVMSMIIGGGSSWTMVSTVIVSIPMTFFGAYAYMRKIGESPSDMFDTKAPAVKADDPFQNIDEMLKD